MTKKLLGRSGRSALSRRWVALFAAVLLVGAVAAAGVGADGLPPPPGWTQSKWDTLSPEDQQIERDFSPPPIADVGSAISGKEAWVSANSDDQIADQLVADAQADGYVEQTAPDLGIKDPQQIFGRGQWTFNRVWVGLSTDGTREVQAYAGSADSDPTAGVMLVREVPLAGDFQVLTQSLYTYPGHGGSFDIQSADGTVLTLTRWIDETQQPGVVSFDVASHTFTAGLYLHGAGGTANPPTLSLDGVTPSGSTDKYSDSASVQFSGGNSWKDIGTWNAAPAGNAFSLGGLDDAHVWVGLKNSDDQGTQFDLRAQVYINGTLVASGTTRCITGITRNQSQAKEATVSFPSFHATTVNASDVVALKLSTRIGTNPDDTKCTGHSSAVGLRAYYDSTGRPARFDEIIGQ